MRLGVVLTGVGVHGAAGAGVLCELFRRQMEPYAVCGLHTGAWPAALFASGLTQTQLYEAAAQAAHMGKRLLRRGAGASSLLDGRRRALFESAGLERLLAAQTGRRILALCPRRAVFPLRMARTGQHVFFASQSFSAQENALVTMQAAVGFAARGAMGLPPMLAPLDWMGSPILPVSDTALAARALFAMGAQRVLVVECGPCARRTLDVLELAALSLLPGRAEPPSGTVRLQVTMPEHIGALSLGEIEACVAVGQKTAERELDRAFETMGMAFCRVLPFRR